MTTTENSRADALTEAATRTIETIKRQLDLIAERAPGGFLDKRPVVQSLSAHVRRLEKALAAPPVEQPAAAPDEGRRIRWGKSDYDRLLDALLRAQIHGFEGEHMLRAKGMLGCCPDVHQQPTRAPAPADERAAFEVKINAFRDYYAATTAGMGRDQLHNVIRDWIDWSSSFPSVVSSSETGAEGAIYQLQQVNGAWLDVTEGEYRVISGRHARIVYRSPAMAAEAVAIPESDRVLDLKTDPEVFAAVLSGEKTHEIRFNDREFVVGDVLRLRETRYTGQEMCGPEPKPLEYTGREVVRAVSHVLEGYGLQPGWVILSFAPPPAQADARMGLMVDQQRTVECADAWLTDKGLPTYTELRALLAAHPCQPEPRDAIARSKRILALADEYHENPTRDTRTALRVALMDEFQPEPRAEVTGELQSIIHELNTYNPAADEYKGAHIHKGWAKRIEAAINTPQADAIDCGCATNEACKMKNDGSCWRAD